MASIQTNNPAFAGTIFGDWARADNRTNVMTVQGTAAKAMALLTIVVACAAVSWQQVANDPMQARGFMIGGMIGGLIFFFATVFKKPWAAVTAPLYSACQGVMLGAISNIYNLGYPGLVVQAIGLTFAATALMLFLYATGIIKVTGRLAAGITAATGALALFYIGSMIFSMFGMHGGTALIRGTSVLGIGISLVAVGLASFNLLLDFDFISRGAEYEAPKYMEWYGAFGLMVTLVWLYMEILRLLSKLRDRN